VLAALLDVDDASDLFNWLRSLPFVTEQEGHCQYHEVVRAPMLRMLRGRSPRQWRRRHRQLASLQQESREALGLQDEEAWTDPGWQGHRLEETYHRLCADPVAALPPALVGVVWAYRASRPFARRWAATLEEAGRDAMVARVQRWGAQLLEHARDDQDCWVELLTLLLDQAPLDDGVRVAALRQRAECHAANRRFEAALADVDSAAQLDPGHPR